MADSEDVYQYTLSLTNELQYSLEAPPTPPECAPQCSAGVHISPPTPTPGGGIKYRPLQCGQENETKKINKNRER